MNAAEHRKLARVYRRIIRRLKANPRDLPSAMLLGAGQTPSFDTVLTEVEIATGYQDLQQYERDTHAPDTVYGLAARMRVCQDLSDRHDRLADRSEAAAARAKRKRRVR